MKEDFQSLPQELQNAVMNTISSMEPEKSVEEIKESLEGTQKGGVKNSIRNCLTVFQHDPKLKGALRHNVLTERTDIVKPMWWSRAGSTLTDTDVKYLLLYLEENYGLTSEKKLDYAIQITANENRYHPVRDYLEKLRWDGTLKQRQQDFMQEDAQAGMITAFLEDYSGDRVCSRLLFAEALKHAYDEPLDWQLRDICQIMNSGIADGTIKGWKAYKNPKRYKEYGSQKGWERVNRTQDGRDGFASVPEQMEIPFS